MHLDYNSVLFDTRRMCATNSIMTDSFNNTSAVFSMVRVRVLPGSEKPNPAYKKIQRIDSSLLSLFGALVIVFFRIFAVGGC
mmetsp:Transcript_11535/g.23405  ORF Transcript_11535/g.23405 Transcript_11535/m.23405 type:complete len:82 (-) Transcript_11535:683-928(-)